MLPSVHLINIVHMRQIATIAKKGCPEMRLMVYGTEAGVYVLSPARVSA
jgi:hypothetical protein